ncbi:MAG TPA: GNAT family N-acetyltransferase [Streptosporangiaceae bacterium]
MTTAVEPISPSHPAFGQVADLFDDYRAHYGLPRAERRTHDWLAAQLARQVMLVAALADGRARGFVTAVVLPASLMLGTAWSVRDLYVAPRYRRGGVARALLQHVADAARAIGAARVSLQTEAGNTAALALYAAAGFEPVEGLTLLSLDLAPGEPDGQSERASEAK